MGRVDSYQSVISGLKGDLRALVNSEFERKIGQSFVGYASIAFRQRYGRPLRRSRLLYDKVGHVRSDFEELLSNAVDSELITLEERIEIELSDAIMRGDDYSRQVYWVGEISLTVNNHDIDRAVSRAVILSKATGSDSWPLVIGDTIPDPQRARADTEGVPLRQVAE